MCDPQGLSRRRKLLDRRSFELLKPSINGRLECARGGGEQDRQLDSDEESTPLISPMTPAMTTMTTNDDEELEHHENEESDEDEPMARLYEPELDEALEMKTTTHS